MIRAHRVHTAFPVFDPERGTTIKMPERMEPGYWAGCPGILYDAASGRFLMTYRERRPRGHAIDRGWRSAIAASSDGLRFDDIWAVHKSELSTSSMERTSLLPAPDGGYLLYLSYVDPADNRWRVDVVYADTPDAFDVETRSAALTAEQTGTEGVKDPYAMRTGPAVQLLVSYAVNPGFTTEERLSAHADADIFRTDMTVQPTGLATSLDGREFVWHDAVLGVGSGWDRYSARINSVIDLGGVYLGFYDGSASAAQNYEERTGLAMSADLVSWLRLSQRGPWLTSPHASGSLRYLDAVPVGDEWFLYYEYARPDGSHELRMSALPMPSDAPKSLGRSVHHDVPSLTPAN